jgi:hypothetical protein
MNGIGVGAPFSDPSRWELCQHKRELGNVGGSTQNDPSMCGHCGVVCACASAKLLKACIEVKVHV